MRALLATPALIGLWGCPYGSDLPLGSPAEALDPGLLGAWRCADKQDDQPYSFLRYALEGATLRLEALREEPLKSAGSPAAVVEILERRRADPGLFESLLTCTRSPTAAGGAVQAEIEAIEARRVRAMLHRDTAALEPILADDLTYVHTGGHVDTKASFLDSLASGRLEYQSFERDDVVVRVFGQTAVVTGRAAMRVRSGAKDLAFSIRFTDVYVKNDGQWRMIAWQSTRLPER